ncbi:MAG: ABC transporter substrate-binding protein [Treponema sp.]|nr:ABC transporter substrate-binding protein [Treponema sp.]
MELKKLFCFVMIAAFASIMLPGCGAKGKTADAGKTGQSISFWNVFTGSDGEILREIVDKYNTNNARGVVIRMDIMPGDQLAQKLPAAISTGTAPELVLYGIENMADYVKTGSLEPVDDFWEKTGADKSDIMDYVLQYSYINGVQYGTPMQYNVSMLYWNKDLFSAAGLDPDKAPATMDDLASYAAALTNPSKNQYGLGLAADAVFFNAQWLWANGGDILDLKTETNKLASKENLETLGWLQDLVINKKVSPENASVTELDPLFQNGSLAMLVSGPWQINGLKSLGINFGVGAIPKGKVNQNAVTGGCNYVIPKGTSLEGKEAAYDFMAHWLTQDVLLTWSQRCGFPAWSKKLMSGEALKNDKILSDVTEATRIGRNYNIGYPKAKQMDYDVLQPMFEKLFAGAASPEKVLEEAVKALDAVIAQ